MATVEKSAPLLSPPLPAASAVDVAVGNGEGEISAAEFLRQHLRLDLIVAVCKNMGIGNKGSLPWCLRKEISYFARMTTATQDPQRRNVVIMGRRTWDGIPKRFRPLKDRINIVLTSHPLGCDNEEHLAKNLLFTCRDFNDAIRQIVLMRNCVERVWVIGGRRVYESAMASPYFRRLYVTRIEKEYECDTLFPKMLGAMNIFTLLQTATSIPEDCKPYLKNITEEEIEDADEVACPNNYQEAVALEFELVPLTDEELAREEPRVPRGLQSENGVDFLYQVYEKRPKEKKLSSRQRYA